MPGLIKKLARGRQDEGQDPKHQSKVPKKVENWGCMRNFMSPFQTFEDVEGIIQITLVLAVLFMSVVVSAMLSVGRQDLVASDMEWMTIENFTEKLTVDQNGLWHTPTDPFGKENGYFQSHLIAMRGVISTSLFTFVIFLLTILYISMSNSPARESPKWFKHYAKALNPILLLAYVGFLIAFFFGSTAFGNAMAVVYPAVRAHDSKEAMDQELAAHDGRPLGAHSIERMTTSFLSSWSIAGMAVGGVASVLAQVYAYRMLSRSTVDPQGTSSAPDQGGEGQAEAAPAGADDSSVVVPGAAPSDGPKDSALIVDLLREQNALLRELCGRLPPAASAGQT